MNYTLKKTYFAVSALLLMLASFSSCGEDSTISLEYMVTANAYAPNDATTKSIAEAIVAYQTKEGLLEKSFTESMEGDDLSEDVRNEMDKTAGRHALERLQDCNFAKIIKDAGITVPDNQSTIYIYYYIGYPSTDGGLVGKHELILEIAPSALK